MADRHLLNLLNECGNALFEKYNLREPDVRQFLVGNLEYSDRCDAAVELADQALRPHLKGPMAEPLHLLFGAEFAARFISEWHREHLVHSVLVFLLGAAIDWLYLAPKCPGSVDKLAWKLAALFHDSAYPIEIASRMIHQFSSTMAQSHLPEVDRLPGGRPNAVRVVPDGYVDLLHGRDALEMFRDQLVDWQLPLDPWAIYRRHVNHEGVDHGILSALAVLHFVDRLYERANPQREGREMLADDGEYVADFDETNFVTQNLSACTAIFLHNLPREDLNGRLHPVRNHLAFLLRLSDLFQEWGRPGAIQAHSYGAEWFGLQVDGDRVVLTVDAGNPPAPGKPQLRRVNELQQSLEQVLIVHAGEIQVQPAN